MVLQIKAKFSRIKFDDKKYLRDTDRMINKIIKEAAREFLIAALNAPSGAPNPVQGGTFPVQTGEAAGSFLPLARLLTQARQGVSFTIIQAVDSRYSDGRLRPNYTARGAAQGSARIGKTGRQFIYTFDFSTLVEHFQYLESESNPKVPSAPWFALAAGYEAFTTYIDTYLTERVPKITEYLYTEDVNIG